MSCSVMFHKKTDLLFFLFQKLLTGFLFVKKAKNDIFFWNLPKNWESAFSKNFFFITKNCFSKFFWFQESVIERIWNEIEDNTERICGRFSSTAAQKIDFTAFGLPRDQPLAWELSGGNVPYGLSTWRC